MADFIATATPWLLAGMLTYLLHSTLFIGGVWGWLAFRPQTEHAVREQLWKWAIVAGFVTTPLQITAREFQLLPVPLAMSLSLWNAPPAGEINTTTNITLDDSGLDLRSGEDTTANRSEHPVATVSSNNSEIPAGSTAVWSPVSLRTSLAAGLAIVILLPLGYLAWQQLSLVRFVSRTKLVTTGEMREELSRLCESVGVRRMVQLLAGANQTEPAAYGLFRWRILLPERAFAPLALSRQERRALLAHELAHLVRRDTYWLWVTQLACTCFGFQLLNRLARHEWRKSGEFLCDRWAITNAVPPLDLARCLTTVASWKLPVSPAPCLSAIHGPPELSKRVELLLEVKAERNPKRKPQNTGLIVGIWGALLGLMVWCVPGPHASAQPRSTQTMIQQNVFDRDASRRPFAFPMDSDPDPESPQGGQFPGLAIEMERLDFDLRELDNELEDLESLVHQTPRHLRREVEQKMEVIASQIKQLELLRDGLREQYEATQSRVVTDL